MKGFDKDMRCGSVLVPGQRMTCPASCSHSSAAAFIPAGNCPFLTMLISVHIVGLWQPPT